MEEIDLRNRLPLIYEGERRVGKTKRLVEFSKEAVKNGRNIAVVVLSGQFIQYFNEDLGVPRHLIVHSIGQMENIVNTGVKDITWFVDEWWLQDKRKRIFLFKRSWKHGDEVVGVGTHWPDDNIRVREFAQHFEVNPNLVVADINKDLLMLYGKPDE